MFSSEVMSWSTPQWLFDQINQEFNFTLDACADKSNHKCNKYYTESDNGLVQSWNGERVWINPPYGREQKAWIQKAYEESDKAISVLLIPARPDTRVFHEIIAPHAAEIRFLKGRIKFSGHKNAAPFPSCLVIFDKTHVYEKRTIFVEYKNCKI